jgi:hypothetical protein
MHDNHTREHAILYLSAVAIGCAHYIVSGPIFNMPLGSVRHTS